jgi:hypothetical protein
VNVARILLPSTCHPRVALARDGALYDVETLEAELGAVIEVPGAASDFHTRVVALGLAGLAELDAALLKGRRPTRARVDAYAPMVLAPLDPERGSVVHVEVRANRPAELRLGFARTTAGTDALVDLPSDATEIVAELGLGVFVGDELRDADEREAREAIAGFGVFVEWRALDVEREGGAALPRGLRTQLGPSLAARGSMGRWQDLRFELAVETSTIAQGRLGELSLSPAAALAFASRAVPLLGGDVVTLGTLARVAVPLHTRIHAAIERVGRLTGVAVERR